VLASSIPIPGFPRRARQSRLHTLSIVGLKQSEAGVGYVAESR
jgi:hypothetical protein